MAKFAPRRILCPIDFSEYSGAALRLAGNLALSLGAEIRILHAQRFDAPLYFTSAQLQSLRRQVRRSLRGARKYVEDFAARHLPDAVRRSVHIIERDPVEAILRMHRDWAADLVVMGTHGRTGLTRIRLGSVMESVLRQIKGPMLTVGPGVKVAPRPIRRILCPVDFSDSSREMLEHAADLAEKTDAELSVYHVPHAPSAESPEDAGRALCDWIPPQVRVRCKLHEALGKGKPSESIVAEAKRSQADLIVLGARPRSYLGRLVFGSTTEEVIRTAPCPVLSVIRNRRLGPPT
jgi:nucleotide-binding universal stress UspA family protein